jgi:hypothetical protein
LSDEALERLLFPPPPLVPDGGRPTPDWPALHLELSRPNVTLSLLWEEYRAANPSGYGYSRFCELYRAWKGKLSPTMRQSHVAGEKMFVDYAGTGIEIVDPESGEVRQAQVFLAVLGASNYTYAEAGWSQGLQDWIGAHARAFRLFAELQLGRGDGRFPRLFRALVRADLLILDDWGPERFGADERRDLLEIVEDRYGNASTLITSQLPLASWHEVVGEPTFADAILDRIVHNAYRLELDGESLRKRPTG